MARKDDRDPLVAALAALASRAEYMALSQNDRGCLLNLIVASAAQPEPGTLPCGDRDTMMRIATQMTTLENQPSDGLMLCFHPHADGSRSLVGLRPPDRFRAAAAARWMRRIAKTGDAFFDASHGDLTTLQTNNIEAAKACEANATHDGADSPIGGNGDAFFDASHAGLDAMRNNELDATHDEKADASHGPKETSVLTRFKPLTQDLFLASEAVGVTEPEKSQAPRARGLSDRRRISQRAVATAWAAKFDTFWAQYPRHGGTSRKEAARRWGMIAPATTLDESVDAVAMTDLYQRVVAGLRADAQSDQWRDGERFIPHASTWLNQRRWEAHE